MRKNLTFRTNIALGLIFAFLSNAFGPLPTAQADEFRLPAPGVRVHLSPEFNPPILKGIKVHPDNPFRFDFILDQGDSPSLVKEGDRGSLKQEATKLIKYFLASLTIPEKDLWVNLSPYEKDRIIPNSFGLTEMGRDLLAEDYMLKQITASLIYPEDGIGKKFWKRIYEEAEKKFGTTNIPVNTFNKVWIVPEKAVVYENAKAGTAYVVESKLKVMLEQDYLALSKNNANHSLPLVGRVREGGDVNALGSQIVREIVIPELTKEVNEDKNFAQLRQVYNSLILATWYKKKIKDSIFAQVYENKNKVAGVSIDDPQEKQKIYERYLQAFKKGAYNYIKEDIDPITKQTIPRKYFSGGVSLNKLFGIGADAAMRVFPLSKRNINDIGSQNKAVIRSFIDVSGSDNAMDSDVEVNKLIDDFTKPIIPQGDFILNPALYRMGAQTFYNSQIFPQAVIQDDEQFYAYFEIAGAGLSDEQYTRADHGLGVLLSKLEEKNLTLREAEEIVYHYIKEATGKQDPLLEYKRRAYGFIFEQLPYFDSVLNGIQNDEQRFRRAVFMAINGNKFGSARFSEVIKINNQTEFSAYLRNMEGEPTLKTDDRNILWHDVQGGGKNIVFILDNVIEDIYDLPLLRELLKQGHHVTVVTKSSAADNDTTFEDFQWVLQQEAVKNFLGKESLKLHVIASGSATRSTDLRRSTPEFIQAMERADVIMVAGEGNRGGLITLAGFKKPIYSFMYAKAAHDSHGVEKGTAVIERIEATKANLKEQIQKASAILEIDVEKMKGIVSGVIKERLNNKSNKDEVGDIGDEFNIVADDGNIAISQREEFRKVILDGLDQGHVPSDNKELAKFLLRTIQDPNLSQQIIEDLEVAFVSFISPDDLINQLEKDLRLSRDAIVAALLKEKLFPIILSKMDNQRKSSDYDPMNGYGLVPVTVDGVRYFVSQSAKKAYELGLLPTDGSDIVSLGVSAAAEDEIFFAKVTNSKIIATTLDEKGVKIAKSKAKAAVVSDRIDFRLEDAQDRFQMDDQSAGFVYSRLMMHYLTQPQFRHVLSEIKRILKPGKKAMVVVRSTADRFARQAGASIDEITGQTTYTDAEMAYKGVAKIKRLFLSEDQLKKLAEEAGLQEESASKHRERLTKDWKREVPEWVPSSLLTMVLTDNAMAGKVNDATMNGENEKQSKSVAAESAKIVADEIARTVVKEAKPGHRYVIGVGGAAGIGKTFFSDALDGALKDQGRKNLIIDMDGFFKSPEERKALGTEWGEDHVRIDDMRNMLIALRSGAKEYKTKRYNRNAKTGMPKMEDWTISFEGYDTFIFDGLYSINNEGRLGNFLEYIDLPIYMDADMVDIQRWRFEQEKQKAYPRTDEQMERHWKEGIFSDTHRNVMPSKANTRIVIFVNSNRTMKIVQGRRNGTVFRKASGAMLLQEGFKKATGAQNIIAHEEQEKNGRIYYMVETNKGIFRLAVTRTQENSVNIETIENNAGGKWSVRSDRSDVEVITAPQGEPKPELYLRSDTYLNTSWLNIAQNHYANKLVDQIIAQNNYGPSVQAALKELAATINNGGLIEPLPNDTKGGDAAYWNNDVLKNALSRHLGWGDDISSTLAMAYFHRLVLEKVNYWETGEDPYSREKQKALNDFLSSPKGLSAYMSGFAQAADPLSFLLNVDLWMNNYDSVNPIDPNAKQNFLIDDRQAIVKKLKSGLNIIEVDADNAGPEITADLWLTQYLLDNNLVKQVILNVKNYPFFISDATKGDVEYTVERLILQESKDPRVAELGKRLAALIQQGKLIISSDRFSTSGLTYDKRPESKQKPDLRFVNGDWNYRLVMGNLHWGIEADMKKVILSDVPVIIKRTVKSKTVIGARPDVVQALAAKDPDWFRKGQGGMLQFVEPDWVLVPELDNKIILNTSTGGIRFAGNEPVVRSDFTLLAERHGETFANVIDRDHGPLYQGSLKDEPMNQLTPQGREQNEKGALELFNKPEIQKAIQRGEKIVVITSQLQRSKDTAAPFIKLVEQAGGKIEYAPEIIMKGANEINYGSIENKRREEMSPQELSYIKGYTENLNATVKLEDGESYLDLLIRVKKWLEELKRLYAGRTVVAFGHGTHLSAARILLEERKMTNATGYINRRDYAPPNSIPFVLSPDHAMFTERPKHTGGIDLTKVEVDSRFRGNDREGGGNDNTLANDSEGIKFHIDPAMLQQLQNAPGFVPVIIDIQSLPTGQAGMTDIQLFLGVKEL